MRILMIKLSSIGDVVHTLPTLAAMRRALPVEAHISWLVERKAAEILRDNPLLDSLIEVDTKALRRLRSVYGETLLTPRQQLHRLRASAFDLTLDFQGLYKSAFLARLSGARARYGFAREALREPLSRLLQTNNINVPLRSHVIVKNLSLAARALNIELPHDPDRFEFPIYISEQHRREAETAAAWTHGDYAILNPGGGWETKLWDTARFGRLADELWTQHKLRSIVTYGPGEEHLAQAVIAASRSNEVRSAMLSLKGFYALACDARLYVGGDTGPTHLAVAASAPIVGLFGPTEWWRNGSPRAADICVERTDIGCRENCHRRECAQWICMDIEVGGVLAAASERLQRAAAQKIKAPEVTVHA